MIIIDVISRVFVWMLIGKLFAQMAAGSWGRHCLPSATMAARGATCRHLQEVFPAVLTINGLSFLQTPASVGEKFPDSLLLAGLSLPLLFFPGLVAYYHMLAPPA